MMGPGETIGLVFVSIFSYSGFTAMLKHRLKMAELRTRGVQNNDAATNAAIEQLRDELRQLRDTALRYDMSFDAALTRMEERVDRLETRSYTTTTTTTSDDAVANLRARQ